MPENATLIRFPVERTRARKPRRTLALRKPALSVVSGPGVTVKVATPFGTYMTAWAGIAGVPCTFPASHEAQPGTDNTLKPAN